MRIKTTQEWEDAITWNGDNVTLTSSEESRNQHIQDLVVKALDAANNGDDFSCHIHEIIKKYGSYEYPKVLCACPFCGSLNVNSKDLWTGVCSKCDKQFGLREAYKAGADLEVGR